MFRDASKRNLRFDPLPLPLPPQACARMAQCTQTSCVREVNEREMSSAYTECMSLCNEMPAGIIPLASSPCEQVWGAEAGKEGGGGG